MADPNDPNYRDGFNNQASPTHNYEAQLAWHAGQQERQRQEAAQRAREEESRRQQEAERRRRASTNPPVAGAPSAQFRSHIPHSAHVPRPLTQEELAASQRLQEQRARDNRALLLRWGLVAIAAVIVVGGWIYASREMRRAQQETAAAYQVRQERIQAIARMAPAPPAYAAHVPDYARIRADTRGTTAIETAARRMSTCSLFDRVVRSMSGPRLFRGQLTPRGVDHPRAYDAVQSEFALACVNRSKK
jgi:hypothetical protein